MSDYDDLLVEKLDLLMKLGETIKLVWQGQFRPALSGGAVFPRPHQAQMPIWVGVAGTLQSFGRAGRLGLPLMIAIIGGTFEGFRLLVDLFRQAGKRAGHNPAELKVGVHAMGFVAASDDEARSAFLPGWAQLIGSCALECGWSKPTRAQKERAGSHGAFLVGAQATGATKSHYASDVCAAFRGWHCR
ncbi:LLM class flavin-dependent oxidoreductase [Pseudoroseomonas globiformis]|uniref:LLM class flavin-dependent oxidoreductase n=1 Tax=Teichococcus globiformis TaxID=2307229 RepID=A0ABV7G450_9PROT